jgi:Na+/phosphate symporter
LKTLVLDFNSVEMDMLYETRKMQMIYQHVFVDIGNITITIPFTGLLVRTKIFRPILRTSAHLASTHQLAIQIVQVLLG